MSKTYIPAGYQSVLTLYETQNAIGVIHHAFEEHLGQTLNLKRVSAPLFVDPATGLNDNLSGVERPVSFEIPATGTTAEVVHSLAKWKRMALYRYDFRPGKGLYTNMNAIRRDETLDNLHSIYVDQWDWERVITPEKRNIQELKFTVQGIVLAICDTLEVVKKKYPRINTELCREVKFITSQELEDKYPDLTPKEREHAICREYKTVFIMQIGDILRSGKPHDGRSPDYDDWQLNGDLLFYNPVMDNSIELSSMGIRVDTTRICSILTPCYSSSRFAVWRGPRRKSMSAPTSSKTMPASDTHCHGSRTISTTQYEPCALTLTRYIFSLIVRL